MTKKSNHQADIKNANNLLLPIYQTTDVRFLV